MTTNIKIVAGANYGDEGKGLTTAYLAKQELLQNRSVIVVLSNGGAQRGHTVETSDGKRHVFHHFGSATILGVPTFLNKNFIVDPMIFNKEYEELQTNFAITPIVFSNLESFVVTPFDVIANQLQEECRGNARHGSCGCGIWECVERNSEKNDHLCFKARLREIYYWSYKKRKEWLEEVRSYHLEKLSNEIKNSDLYRKWEPIINNPNLIENTIRDLDLFSQRIIVRSMGFRLKKYDTIIYENGQGLLLDETFTSDKRYSTPSWTGIKNPFNDITDIFTKEEEKPLVEVIYVTRPYLTRHGEDPYFCENLSRNEEYPDKTNGYNNFQGRFKYGTLCYPDLISRITMDINSVSCSENDESITVKRSICITHVDEVDSQIKFFKKGNEKLVLPSDIQYYSIGPKIEDMRSTNIEPFIHII